MQLPESDYELRGLLDRTAIAMCCVDADGVILWANSAELHLVGYPEPEYVGRNIADFLVEPEAAAALLGRLVHDGSVRSQETWLRTGDGSLRQVLIDGDGLFRSGRFVHGRLVTRDITTFMEEAQEARQRAEATSHLKDEFLALLSHELRTPLGAILVWLGLLRAGGFDPTERDRAFSIIERSARSLERIIEDLLHASRIAAGGLMLHPQLVDVRTVVQIAIDSAAGDAAVKGLELRWALGDFPIWVRGDPGRLQQVVSNLLSNAIKFTPAGGGIEVSLDTIQEQARLRVADGGEGMSPEFLPFAFERFRQQDSTSTRAHHGLGLGLYVVRHVVGHHGGFVTAESAGPGRGSTFTVLLPRAAQHPEASPSVDREDPRGDRPPDGLKVLIVEDDEDTREAMRLLLQQNGMSVATASSARQAFDLVQDLRPDIILSDLAMPGEDGLSLIRRVRVMAPERGGLIPAAALSAYAGAADREEALLAGFQHHLAKPVVPAHLFAVIARMARGEGREG